MRTRKIILIIDDDKDFQIILTNIFQKSGFMVKSLLNGLVKDFINDPPVPDIILLDMDLPFANGVEVGKQLKSNPATRNVPVIMVSANPYVDQLCKEAGAVDYVQKPFNLKSLIQKIKDRIPIR